MLGPPRRPRQVERVFWRLIREGLSTEAAAAGAGISLGHAGRVFRQGGGMTTIDLDEPAGRYLSFAEREDLAVWRGQKLSIREMARRLGRAPTTVSRELARNAPNRWSPYRASTAQSRADERARRPKPSKIAAHPPLRDYIQDKLGGIERWSPEQISQRLQVDFPDDERMRVSHEAIYQAIYVQGRGALRRELAACLRTGRTLRKPQRRADGRREHIKGMVMISERPAEAEDRAVPGHWEGDLIIGAKGGSAIGTLVERKCRYTMLLHLPGDRSPTTVRDAITAKIATLPEQLRRSLTWDQGLELGQHAQLSIDADIDVYFCDPHSPWQRGTNENTNGLLRQYFPKSTDLSVHGPDRLDEVAVALNGRPRKTLAWKTPAEAYAALLSELA